jgi:multiple sugar transport system permease protein
MRRWLLTVVGAGISALYLFPVYWIYASALKTSDELNASPPTLVPHAPTLAAFRWIFERENIALFMTNSVVLSVGVTVLTLVLATGAAYSLARKTSLWMDAMLVGVMLSQVLSQVLPPPLLVTPMFVIFRQLGLINTQIAVILATTTKTLPFAIVMLRTSFAQVPVDLEDAARVDGSSRVMAFLRITLPLARVGYIVVGALVFLLAYGEFVYPVSLLNRKSLQPATVGLYGFVGADYSDWGNAMAFASVFVTPVIIVFMLLQRRIVSGLTAGALK